MSAGQVCGNPPCQVPQHRISGPTNMFVVWAEKNGSQRSAPVCVWVIAAEENVREWQWRRNWIYPVRRGAAHRYKQRGSGGGTLVWDGCYCKNNHSHFIGYVWGRCGRYVRDLPLCVCACVYLCLHVCEHMSLWRGCCVLKNLKICILNLTIQNLIVGRSLLNK